MERVHRRWGAAALAAVLAMGARRVRAEDVPIEQLRRELRDMQGQLEKLQEQIKKQQQVIDKLSAGQQKAPATAAAPPPAATAADEERLKRQVTEQVLRRMQPALAAANKTFPSQFNPAIGLILDNVFSYSEKDRGDFEFRAAELGLSASVDPFARGYAIITGSPDGFDVEEAAIVTTSLPYNLTLKGGRFFADFGRLSKFHDHDLPFVNRPIALDRFIGGESQADGVELSYLVPLPQYLTLTAGAYNKLGAENDRVSNTAPRDFSQFTYLGRAATFLNLNDANSIDLGTSYAYTPEVKVDNGASRHLAGIDLTYRYIPLSQASYRGLIWGSEFLYNQEDRPVGGFPAAEPALSLARGLGLPPAAPAVADPPASLVFKRRDAASFYSYLEARLSRRFHPGFLFDWVQDVDHVTGDTKGYSPYLTIWASEFQRFRLQYTRLDAPEGHDNQFFLQWTVILGSHVHGFRDR
ncbi:MAG: hypothetical protein E6J55_05845 [Deltaproteobacteria bacterium]|nr:MAG: hypothetical protein E6J55_05845 [Deltaproteobacteria bacterium]